MPTIINGSSPSLTFSDSTTQASAGLVAGGTIATGTITSATLPTATITTLNAPSGVLATQNGMTGIAKAWVNYNGSAQTITASFNVSSVTRNSTGNYTVNFSTSMPNADYSVAGFCKNNGSVDMTIGATPSMTKTSSAFQFYCVSFAGNQTESATACVQIFGA